MRSLRARRDQPGPAEVSERSASSWNTLYTLGAGAVADVDSHGAIFPRARPLSVEVWFGYEDRWLSGDAGDGVRQRRIDGLPIIETRQRAGDSDLVQTAWADEPGDGRGRTIVELRNETGVAVVAAIVIRPLALTGVGTITELRVADDLVVADRLPVVKLGRKPGDVIVASEGQEPTLLTQLQSAGAEPGVRVDVPAQIHDENGQASLAALIPLTPGVDRQLQIVDGREESTVAPAPLDRVIAGWRSHLGSAADIELPGWPTHLFASLASGTLGAIADVGRAPLGDESWTVGDDALIAAALGYTGQARAASGIVDHLLDQVTTGQVSRQHWPAIGGAIASVVDDPSGVEILGRHGEAVAAIVGHCFTSSSMSGLRARLVRAIETVHGPVAARDAGLLTARSNDDEAAMTFVAHGAAIEAEFRDAMIDVVERAKRPYDIDTIALGLALGTHAPDRFEPVTETRALAGSTWSWPRSGCGDSPHARAALLLGLRNACLAEGEGAHGGLRLDLLPAANHRWYGRNLSFTNLATPAGHLSCALRWHGERPALLWEFDEDGLAVDQLELTCSSLDPDFVGTARNGEVLLAAPPAAPPVKGAGQLGMIE